MTDSKFIVCKHGDHSAENKFYHECRERRVPHVVVSRRAKYATVSWDHLCVPMALDNRLQADAKQIAVELQEVFNRGCGPKSRFRITGLLGNFDNFDHGAAETAAGEIYDILISRMGDRPATPR
jgi:hypothetical protein